MIAERKSLQTVTLARSNPSSPAARHPPTHTHATHAHSATHTFAHEEEFKLAPLKDDCIEWEAVITMKGNHVHSGIPLTLRLVVPNT